MKTRFLIPLFGLSALTFSACNLFGGLSKPSNDAQYLEAARACLDRGDFQCALDNYNALSNSENDRKISETSLTRLAQAKIFSFSDLIGSLGSGTGSGSTFVTMANDLAKRSAANESNRLLIKSLYNANAGITNSKLRAFSRFIAALSMMNEILAEVAGPDQTLRASDIVADPTLCSMAACLPGDPNYAACDIGTSSTYPVYTNGVDNSGDPVNLDSSSVWAGTPSLQMILVAASVANTEASIFNPGLGNAGIFNAIQTLGTFGGTDRCIRQQIIEIFGLK
ncbi:MAG: hypothetical protein EBX52_02640 [Proteobacteria bacterium]|nr:hypothetical protein [Pseudomonadota bacterium]